MNPPWRYRFLVRLLSPALLGYTLWRAMKDGGSRYWRQRLSLAYSDTQPETQAESLWVHAASVGEVFTVLPLVKAWQQAAGGATVLMTTGTPTGAAVLQQQNLPGIRHHYLPLDFPGACRRFVQQLHTRQAWFVETEIWPWLYAQCADRGIKLIIVNGRLSSRTSAQAHGILGSSYRRALQRVQVLARSEQDAASFLALGAPGEQVRVAGNLKCAAAPASGSAESLLQRDYVLAASTHEDEERQLASSWIAHAADTDLLVIVPRHPERGNAIARQLSASGIRVTQRSTGHSQASEQDQVYLADTLGELQAWYRHARATFVGGSLIPRGGHNMLEPARYACPIVVGPHTGNFADIMHLLVDADALQIAGSADEVVRFLLAAGHGDPLHQAMGERARTVADDSEAVLQGYLQLLRP
jgi:3-deoxy-D-manno-octulosonic-acid transferase